MSTTAGSSAPYQNALDRTVPSTYAGQLRNDLNELQAYRAQQPDPDKLQAKKRRALHAGATKTERLHAVIDAMVELHQLQLRAWTGSDTSRACWLTKLIHPDAKLDRSGRPSGWRTVYNHLKTLSL